MILIGQIHSYTLLPRITVTDTCINLMQASRKLNHVVLKFTYFFTVNLELCILFITESKYSFFACRQINGSNILNYIISFDEETAYMFVEPFNICRQRIIMSTLIQGYIELTVFGVVRLISNRYLSILYVCHNMNHGLTVCFLRQQSRNLISMFPYQRKWEIYFCRHNTWMPKFDFLCSFRDIYLILARNMFCFYYPSFKCCPFQNWKHHLYQGTRITVTVSTGICSGLKVGQFLLEVLDNNFLSKTIECRHHP